MIEELRRISRTHVVQSSEQRELDDRIAAELSDQYHRILELSGRMKILASCIDLMDAAIVNVINAAYTGDANTVIIGPGTGAIYPTAVTDDEKAERITEFGIIIAKRVSTKLVFTDANGNVYPFIDIVRSSNNALYLQQPDRIIENSVFHALDSDVPYLAHFVKENMTRSNVILDIVSTDRPVEINAVRFKPMPVVGSVQLDYVRYGDGQKIVMNGAENFDETAAYESRRTFPAYVHFEPVITSRLQVSFSSEIYSASSGSVAVGVNQIIGEHNVYAETSYIGYEVEFPDGTSRLTRIEAIADEFAGSLDNIRMRVYDSLENFNAMNSNYVTTCESSMNTNIAGPGPLYLLVELSSVNNTTPCIGKIQLEFD